MNNYYFFPFISFHQIHPLKKIDSHKNRRDVQSLSNICLATGSFLFDKNPYTLVYLFA